MAVAGATSEPERRVAAGRGVLTHAYGPRRYSRLAVNLALSLERHCPELPRAVVTDGDDPELAAAFPLVIRVGPRSGFLGKLHMYDETPFEETLYLDCDCLVVRPLDEVWAILGQGSFVVPAYRDPSPRHLFAPERLPQELRRPVYPAFNGGLYYFRKDATSREVLADARRFAAKFDEWGLRRLRGELAEEPLVSLALARRGLLGVDDGGRTMRSLVASGRWISLDVLTGRSRFRKYGQVVSPSIIHFAGPEADGWLYRREVTKLRLTRRGAPRRRASLLATLRFPGAPCEPWLRERGRRLLCLLREKVPIPR